MVGVNSDPLTWADLTTVIIGIVVYALAIFFSVVMVCMKWRFAAVRSKSPVLNLISVLAGFSWFLSSCVANGLIENREGFFGMTCRFWWVWGQIMGVVVWNSCLSARLIQLFWVFVKLKKSLIPPVLMVVLMSIPGLIVCICATSVGADVRDGGEPGCQWESNWVYGSAAVILVYFASTWVFAFMTRKLRQEFNEFHKILIGIIVSIISLAILFSFYVAQLYYRVWGRIICCVCMLVIGNFYFWVRNYEIVWRIGTLDKKWFEDWILHYKSNTMSMFNAKMALLVESSNSKHKAGKHQSPEAQTPVKRALFDNKDNEDDNNNANTDGSNTDNGNDNRNNNTGRDSTDNNLPAEAVEIQLTEIVATDGGDRVR